VTSFAEDPAKYARESVARASLGPMKASTAAIGVLTDPPLVAAASAITIMTALLLLRLLAFAAVERGALGAPAAGPLAIALCALLALSGARGRVVKWLASLPFPVDTSRAAQAALVRIWPDLPASMPSREEATRRLRRCTRTCFALEFYEDEPEVEVPLACSTRRSTRRARATGAIAAREPSSPWPCYPCSTSTPSQPCGSADGARAIAAAAK